jgi:hypothetical protein
MALLGFETELAETAADFEKQLEHFGATISGNVERAIRKTLIDTWAEITKISPVLNGIYRASHGIMVSEPTGDEPTAEMPGDGSTIPAPTMPMSGSERGFTWELKDNEVWFYNNLVYAAPLENGHSKDQAPNGIYRVALKSIERKLAKNLLEMGLI